MRTINLLIGNTDRRINNLVEALVLDVCFERAAVESYRVGKLSEFLRQALSGQFELAILAPDWLCLEDTGRKAPVTLQQVASSIRIIKRQTPTPVLAINVSRPAQHVLTDTGVDCVFGMPFNVEDLRPHARRLLQMPETVEAPEPKTVPLLAALLQTLRRPRRA